MLRTPEMVGDVTLWTLAQPSNKSIKYLNNAGGGIFPAPGGDDNVL